MIQIMWCEVHPTNSSHRFALTWYDPRLLIRHIECESLLARECHQKNVSTSHRRDKLRHPRYPAPALFSAGSPLTKDIPTKEPMAAMKASCICPKVRAGTWIGDSQYYILVLGHHLKCGPVTVSRDLLWESVPCFNRTEKEGDQMHDVD